MSDNDQGIRALFLSQPARLAVLPDDSPLRGLRWVVCVRCGRGTYEKPGRDVCVGCCREAEGLAHERRQRHRNRQYLSCSHPQCDKLIVDRRGRPLVGHEAATALCTKHLLEVRTRKADPEAPRPSVLPTPADVDECCNLVKGECLFQPDGKCVVVEGGRCSWYERAVAPAPEKDRHCIRCGRAVAGRRQVCDNCKRKQARERQRELRGRKSNAE